QPRERNGEHAEADPARLEVPPRKPGCSRADEWPQTLNRSTTSVTGTTWRLNFSSEAGMPAATPISCERWRIGIWNFRPVDASSFDCHASSDRWQSGQGVTIAS